ncbi:MAG: M28 family peptidase [Candidatus Rokubacteria bacterium]|nr:M28 family peptidase [Candidatus Rokubacteria bacterium]
MKRHGLVVLLALVALATAGQTPARREFDGAAALRHVERLVAIGPRPAGSPEGAKARAYIEAELRAAGVETRVMPFDATTPQGRLPMANVIGILPGKRADVIMIAGHYDTKWFPNLRFVGANDGGSSTALLLQLARELAKAPRELTYWITFFDGEEARGEWSSTDSLYGSRHLAAELTRTARLPRAMIVVDMIGDRDLGIRRELLSTAWLTDIVWETARRLGYGRHFRDDILPVEDDHAPFLKAGVPATLLIDFDYPPWHTADDTLDKVSAKSLAVVGEVVREALPAVEQALLKGTGGKRP